jgi:D-beta-D-heptose 7-phosphate kinase/D-beta-D-heptose 1-phosphate adenosyltransferase
MGKKVKAVDRLCEIRRDLKRAGKKVVFTNGCFDLLHGGHVHLFRFAKSQGDILCVGVNDDASIRRFKGELRPIFPLAERLEILASLEPIDFLTPFSEDTPLRLITALCPDILVKGGDWKPEEVVGKAEVEASGGRVIIAPFLKGHSSSQIIKNIRASVAAGAPPLQKKPVV